MGLDTSLLRPVAGPQLFDYQGLMGNIDQGQARRTALDAGGQAAGGDYQGAQATALRAGNPQLAGQMFDMGNAEHAAAAKAGVQALMQASDPATWNKYRAHILQASGKDIGPFANRDAVIKSAMDALNPEAAMSRNQAQSNADRTYNLAASQAGASRIPTGYRQSADGNLEPIPGGPASGGKTANAPPGYRWSADSQSLEAIPGGPAEKLPAELAGRVGLAEEFLRQLPDLKKDIAAGAATGPIDFAAGQLGQGRSGEIHRRIASGTDALIRGLTGAGMAMSEAQQYVARYRPQITDNAEVLSDKVNQLEAELRSVMSVASRGRGVSGAPPSEAPAGDPNAAGGYVQAGSKSNPVQVQTPEDAMRLPPGTVFTTPDGRVKVR